MNKYFASVLAIVACAALPVYSQTIATAPSFAAGEQKLAAESLLHSAVSLAYSSSDTPGRASRLVLSAQFAKYLDSQNSKINEFLGSIYEIQGNVAGAAKAAGERLVQTPDNYQLGMTFLKLSLASLKNAQQRIDFLNQQVNRTELDPSVRAEAYVELGKTQIGQDDKSAAAKSFEEALKLDPLLPSALAGKLSLVEKPDDLQRIQTLLSMLKGFPTDVDLAWQLGMLLDNMGIYDQATAFCDYAWQMTNLRNPENSTNNLQSAIEYANVLLDAGQNRKAIEVLDPMLKKFRNNPELLSLLIESYKSIGDERKVKELTNILHTNLLSQEISAEEVTSLKREIAWYYIINDMRMYAAYKFAEEAGKKADDESMDLILGITQLKTDKQSQGLRLLIPLMNKDIYAAAYLAEYYYSVEDAEKGKQAILAGCKLTYRGRGFRLLKSIAQRHNVEIPPHPLAAQARAELSKFDSRFMSIGLSPREFIEVKVEPTAQELSPGEPLELVCTLTNRSEIDIPLGANGVFNPTLSFKITTVGIEQQEFDNLPSITWPAARYLKPKQSVKASVQLDVGAFEEYLSHHALDSFNIVVTAMLDPIQTATGVRSSLPSVIIDKASVRKKDILPSLDRSGEDWSLLYQYAIGYISKDIQQGDIPAKLLAAKRVAMLLTFLNDVEAKQAVMPNQLAGAFQKPPLLSMMQALMRDPSPVVRAEMLSSLQYCRSDNRILRLIIAVPKDPNSLVRYRLAELVGTMKISNLKAWEAGLIKDKDPFVARMAAIFYK